MGDINPAEIYVIQALDKSVCGVDSNFKTYELNLALQVGERVSVFNHNDEPKIQEQDQASGEFLDVPMWGLYHSVAYLGAG